ncbi:MAG: single-stranded-DNA-specific exonuclease RecJ [Ignavibacteria bacterium GWA2_35_9]|nr:MAG: single-stranded-DNA-specific exonuclease RecJ [Ignavibacteria bacterium GWA2_35_9]OGU51733.1 MAG: single-stranded-DNA-specific exonuclease RecJ [Ignavibacteria bacterium GWC2_36_12]
MLKCRWKLHEIQDDFTVKSLADALNVSEVLARLLVIRDIGSFLEAKAFFRPSIDSLYDPLLMDGMNIATMRVINALTENEKICIYGDYDVDGTCSTALLYLFLKELDANVNFYIPKRLTEGYGLSTAGIDYVKSIGTSLLISVDCGITAIEETDYANKLGINVIICDHHQPKETLPNAVAVLDPLKPSCNYPFKYLSGAGIAFKLAVGIADRIGKRILPLKYLDLVALAGAADIVPLIDENRILVREGLNLINDMPRPGIEALIESAGLLAGNLTTGQIVFTIAPRINAVGRLGDAHRAVELLITNNKQEALQLAQVLETENYQRRKIDVDTFDTALDLVENSLDLQNELAIILHNSEWHPGVIGIVASRLVEKYYRPTIMLTTVDGVAKGSARSISNFNIYEALQKCDDILLHFGGHQAAAGLAVEIDKLSEFKSRFNRIVKESLQEENLLPEIHIDSKLKFSEITYKFLKILNRFSPFGPGNMRPVFLSENVKVVNAPKIVGTNHIVVPFMQEGCEKVFDSIGFNMGDYYEVLTKNGSQINIVYTIDKTSKDGRVFPQFKLKDIRTKVEELV